MSDYTLTQAAGYVEKSVALLKKLLERGELAADFTIGRNLMFRRSTLEALSLRQGWAIARDEITIGDMMALTGLSRISIYKLLSKHDIEPRIPKRGSLPARYDRREVERKFLRQIVDSK